MVRDDQTAALVLTLFAVGAFGLMLSACVASDRLVRKDTPARSAPSVGMARAPGQPPAPAPDIRTPGPSPDRLPVVPPPRAEAAEVPEGYRVEVVLSDLLFPSSVEFDDEGAMYVAECGEPAGSPARVLKYSSTEPSQEKPEVVAAGLAAPVTDLLWHEGRLYISHRGKISVLERGALHDLITGLPSAGDHVNNQMSLGPDGMLYVGQGTATNSGVVGVDNFMFGWLQAHPDFCDVPAHDVTLTGASFESVDPLAALTGGATRTVRTSPFQPFGHTVPAGTVVKGSERATGTILRARLDGRDLGVYAWGLRNPFGVAWGPDGKLYAAEGGADERGARPIANCPDALWRLEEGSFCGWPDYAAGVPVTDERYRPAQGPAPQLVMQEHPPVAQPLITLPPHSSVTGIAFSTNPNFGFEGQLFVGASGDNAPVTAAAQERAGFWVQRVDTSTGKLEMFFRARPDSLGARDEEYVTTPGPKRPVDVRFSRDGSALYVVDYGPVLWVRSATGPAPRYFPGTGVLWRITRDLHVPQSPR
jgi:glucose/arabinose dehydrogenase